MGVGKELKERALAASQRAMERLLSDERRATQIATAVGRVQQGRESLVRGLEDVLRGLDVAPREDFKAAGRQLSTLKRRVRDLDRKLEALKKERSA
jgi:polyhydroxyalkanoate synthesis regulator phasin